MVQKIGKNGVIREEYVCGKVKRDPNFKGIPLVRKISETEFEVFVTRFLGISEEEKTRREQQKVKEKQAREKVRAEKSKARIQAQEKKKKEITNRLKRRLAEMEE